MTMRSISQSVFGSPHIINNLGSLSVEFTLEIKQEVLAILDEILSLKGRTASFSEKTPLLGAIPELDSMAVVALITTIEERFGFAVDDDEIEGSTFATVGSLIDFVEDKLAA
jgi:acyl carrier protein